MPDVAVIDSHVHLWNPEITRMTWLDDEPLLNRPFQMPDFFEQTTNTPVKAFVFVEAGVNPHFALLEAQSVAALAQNEPRLAGIVAAAPLEYGKHVRSYLEALAKLGPLIKGVRRLLQDESDPAFCLQPDFVAGVEMLKDFGWSFDICIRHHQLPGVIELVKTCPQNLFVLDHMAKPDIKNGRRETWRTHLTELAALPNVVCKISGLVTEADLSNWVEADLQFFIEHTLDVFGVDRVMFGSDWPVALKASSYTRWVETLDNLTGDLDTEARHKLWADNARRYYRI